jgi:plastocyanin
VAGETAIYHGTEDITGASRVTIDMEDTYFSPTVLRGEPGQRLQLTLRNRGKSPHHFATADDQLIVEVQPGLTADGRITLPSSGNLSFYCLLHRQDAMAGAFNVSGEIGEAEPEPEPTRTR